MNNQLCAHCGDPATGALIREWTGPAGTPARTRHGDREACRAAAALPDADDVPDFVAGARALLAGTSDCTIDGAPAVVVRVAELNDLVARVHQAEAAARTTPPTRCSPACTHGHTYEPPCEQASPPGTCVWPDCLTDGQQAELADDVRRSMLGEATVPAPDQRQVCGCREARFASGGLLPTRTLKPSARTTPDNPPTSGDGRPAGEGLRGLLEHVGIDLTGKTVTIADGPTIAQMHADNARITADNPAVAAPATGDEGLRATPAEAAVNRVRSWIAGEPVTARSGFGDGYREALRDVLDVIDRKAGQ